MKANDLIEKIQGFLLDPKNQFEKEKKTDLKGMLIYGGIGILVLSIISTQFEPPSVEYSRSN